MKKHSIHLIPLLGLGLLSSCAKSTHLVFAQSGVIGIDIAASAEGGPARATIGYDRYTLAFIPKTKIDGDVDAMSIISKSKINVAWHGPQEVHEHFATGDAAVGLAQSDKGIENLGSNTQ